MEARGQETRRSSHINKKKPALRYYGEGTYNEFPVDVMK